MIYNEGNPLEAGGLTQHVLIVGVEQVSLATRPCPSPTSAQRQRARDIPTDKGLILAFQLGAGDTISGLLGSVHVILVVLYALGVRRNLSVRGLVIFQIDSRLGGAESEH